MNPFQLHTKNGVEEVTVEDLGEVTLSGDEIKTAYVFHRFLFEDVIDCVKFPVCFSPESSWGPICTVIDNGMLLPLFFL